jgi:hypothetical protein
MIVGAWLLVLGFCAWIIASVVFLIWFGGV